MNSFESIMPPLGLCKLLAEKLPGVLNDTAPGTTVMMDAPAVWAAISGAGTRDVKIEKDETPESAALRLLFKINGIEVK